MTSISEKPDPAALAAFRQWLVENWTKCAQGARQADSENKLASASLYDAMAAAYNFALAEFDRRFPQEPQP